MSREEMERIILDHIVEGPDYRFICVTIGGRTRNLRVYKDGMVESYEGGRFVQLPSELAKDIRNLLIRKPEVPTFKLHNEEVAV